MGFFFIFFIYFVWLFFFSFLCVYNAQYSKRDTGLQIMSQPHGKNENHWSERFSYSPLGFASAVFLFELIFATALSLFRPLFPGKK